MTTLVCFRADEAEFALPIESVREVRSCEALVPLPAPLPGVAGLLECDGNALAVLDAFGMGRQRQVLMLDHDGHRFGLLVEMVTRVVPIDGPLDPPPHGQEHDCIAGVASIGGQLLFVLDIGALDMRLGP